MRTKRYELVELQVPANTSGTKVQFTDIPQLRTQTNQTITIQAIETFSNQAVTTSPTGIAVATPTQIKSAFLVLNVQGEENIFRIPLPQLNRVIPDQITAANYVPSVDQLQQFEMLQMVDWTKSYVQFATAPNNVSAFSFLFGVHYTRQ